MVQLTVDFLSSEGEGVDLFTILTDPAVLSTSL